ncbi:MAG TPA: phytanoyl-CoA dioxygenase family protein, partial [Blastocatellia bacterium]|nr:phytanoyl-CoA dioxygenase family protein [Blastocatellia bacterium]
MNDLTGFQQNGFAIVPNVLDAAAVAALLNALTRVQLSDAVKQREGRAFGMRRLLELVPAVRVWAESDALLALVHPILGDNAKVVRGIFFDKTPVANWKVPWHQDTMIAVRAKKDVAGFSAWSIKAGVVHTQPPVAVLTSILTVRLHLDDTDETNGALRVIPGSHLHGVLSDDAVQQWKARQSTVMCSVRSGGALLMRPLLLHASSVAAQPTHRRVLHLEYSALDLP